MNKLISTVILAIFTAVGSFGCVTNGSDEKQETTRQEPPPSKSKKVEHKKKKETVREAPPAETSKTEEVKYEAPPPEPVSDKDDEMMREKSLSERQEEYKDQEVMNKKPYKQ
jgi:type IV secretory pathway VirB10-like protein